MGTNPSVTANPHCRAAMEKAITSTGGIIVKFPSKGALMNFRQNCYSIRNKIREKNKKVFPDENHPQHGTSPYDSIFFVMFEEEKTGKWILEIHGENSAENALEMYDKDTGERI